MHVTQRLRHGLPTLRRAEVREVWRALLREAARRGVRTVAYAVMSNHLHWVCLPESRQAMAAALRHVFGQLARRLNRLWRHRGRVFDDRCASTAGRSARQAWHMLAYVLRNPVSAGAASPAGPLDPFVGADEAALGRHPFLRAVFGPEGRELRALLRRMARAPTPFVPLAARQQPSLPGL